MCRGINKWHILVIITEGDYITETFPFYLHITWRVCQFPKISDLKFRIYWITYAKIFYECEINENNNQFYAFIFFYLLHVSKQNYVSKQNFLLKDKLMTTIVDILQSTTSVFSNSRATAFRMTRLRAPPSSNSRIWIFNVRVASWMSVK